MSEQQTNRVRLCSQSIGKMVNKICFRVDLKRLRKKFLCFQASRSAAYPIRRIKYVQYITLNDTDKVRYRPPYLRAFLTTLGNSLRVYVHWYIHYAYMYIHNIYIHICVVYTYIKLMSALLLMCIDIYIMYICVYITYTYIYELYICIYKTCYVCLHIIISACVF